MSNVRLGMFGAYAEVAAYNGSLQHVENLIPELDPTHQLQVKIFNAEL